MRASIKGRTETVKILLEQEGININAKSVSLFLPKFISIIRYLRIIFGNYSKYYKHL